MSKKEGGIFNIADDNCLSTNELIELISRTINRRIVILKINKKLIILLARAGTKLKLPLDTERLRKLTENYVVSNRKIKEYLEIDVLPVSVQDGIVLTIKNF